MNSSPSLNSQQTAALRIARMIRLNIRLNFRLPSIEVNTAARELAFHRISCRAWDEAIALNSDRARAYEMVRGALQLLD